MVSQTRSSKKKTSPPTSVEVKASPPKKPLLSSLESEYIIAKIILARKQHPDLEPRQIFDKDVSLYGTRQSDRRECIRSKNQYINRLLNNNLNWYKKLEKNAKAVIESYENNQSQQEVKDSEEKDADDVKEVEDQDNLNF